MRYDLIKTLVPITNLWALCVSLVVTHFVSIIFTDGTLNGISVSTVFADRNKRYFLTKDL